MNSLAVLLAVLTTARAAFNAASFIPIPVRSGFVTLPSGVGPSGVSSIPLSLAALQATNVSKSEAQNIVPAPGGAPSGVLALQALYPQGSYVPTATNAPRGGFGFYFSGPSSFDFEGTDELLFAYAVYFPPGFQFNMGGKLPGPYGGTTLAEAQRCSGGRQAGRTLCFDLRLMWRTGGDGEIYAYLPDDPANAVLENLKGTVVPDDFGTSIARGAFSFAAGAWTVVAQRVRLNTPGQADGQLELFVGGTSVIHATGLVIRVGNDSTFRGVHCETFFGGNSPNFASPANQSAFFAGFAAAAVAPGSAPAEGKPPYPLANAAASPGTAAPSGGAGTQKGKTSSASAAGPGASPSSGGDAGSAGGPSVNTGGAPSSSGPISSIAVLAAILFLVL